MSTERPFKRHINPYAAQLRQEATETERAVWDSLRNRQLGGYKIRRQASIGPFVVDFLCIERRLVIKIDGGQHDEEADASRTAYLTNNGYRVVRFWNHEVGENLEGVLSAILTALQQP